MTNISYNTGIKTQIRISGHAGAKRENGHDLCCAAESALAYTLIESVKKYCPKTCFVYIKDGYVYISFRVTGFRSLCAVVAVKTVVNGFKMLSDSYPQNVKVQKEKEVKNIE